MERVLILHMLYAHYLHKLLDIILIHLWEYEAWFLNTHICS